jgi:hypothetical protein
MQKKKWKELTFEELAEFPDLIRNYDGVYTNKVDKNGQ